MDAVSFSNIDDFVSQLRKQSLHALWQCGVAVRDALENDQIIDDSELEKIVGIIASEGVPIMHLFADGLKYGLDFHEIEKKLAQFYVDA